MNKPQTKPKNPNFSSGPCAKPPGWSLEALKGAALGRSHRAAVGIEKLRNVIGTSKELLGIPDDYRLAIVPGSDTGAIEMAMWSLLGQRGVDVLAWENFGQMWVVDIIKHLSIEDSRVMDAPYGEITDLSSVDCNRDVIFTWNGTTSGVCVPNGDWIDANRDGLTFCDATSAVFAMELPWDKLDVVTWSWQKVLGGEAAHGMLALSPRAVQRLESHTPSWPMPKVFRMASKGKVDEALFRGATINTPSMLCVEDAIFALEWARSVGGKKGLVSRSAANLNAVAEWVEKTSWVEFLPKNPATRSCTSICVEIAKASGLDTEALKNAPKYISSLLEGEGVAYDLNNHRAAPPSLRIWGGATVETTDIEALLPWLDWAFAQYIKQTN
ncbi:MAG: phosphoserine transaminase [Rhodospirillaceae bacterium]|nr:phosphoserine transaminase [Rhodospirillaceae bacterium]|tara:strand:+ start:52 stop:1203 length:1152 start_codon:yes stop_codon:yes gene_type:complete